MAFNGCRVISIRKVKLGHVGRIACSTGTFYDLRCCRCCYFDLTGVMILGYCERHRVSGVVPADTCWHSAGLEDVVLECLSVDARLSIYLGGIRHVVVGELNPSEVVDIDIRSIACAIGHGHHASALIIYCSAIPAIRHWIACRLCTHGEAVLICFQRVGVACSIVNVFMSAKELAVCKSPATWCSLVCVLERHVVFGITIADGARRCDGI